MAKPKKETRIMKVTLDADEFEKFDQGITHSDNGLRNEKGRLSALPDIAEVTDDDLPYKEIVRTETVYVERERTNDSFGAMLGHAATEIVVDVLSDPEIQEGLANLGKAFWYYKVKPRINYTIQWMKSDKKFETKASRLIASSKSQVETSYEVEVIDQTKGKIVVSGEDATKLVAAVREESKRLSAMIYLLSNIVVKDDKTQEEYVIEQAYIKQLVSEESRNTMEMLVANRQLLDEGTAVCFSDFLNGYIRNGKQRIAIPVSSNGTT